MSAIAACSGAMMFRSSEDLRATTSFKGNPARGLVYQEEQPTVQISAASSLAGDDDSKPSNENGGGVAPHGVAAAPAGGVSMGTAIHLLRQKAVMSHLELATANLELHASSLQDEHINEVSEFVKRLQKVVEDGRNVYIATSVGPSGPEFQASCHETNNQGRPVLEEVNLSIMEVVASQQRREAQEEGPKAEPQRFVVTIDDEPPEQLPIMSPMSQLQTASEDVWEHKCEPDMVRVASKEDVSEPGRVASYIEKHSKRSSRRLKFSTSKSSVGTRKLRDQIMELFNNIDRNNNGYLELPELRTVLQACGVAPALCTIIMRKMDLDGDDRISRSEWDAFADKVDEEEQSAIETTFFSHLQKHVAEFGKLYPIPENPGPPRFMLHHDGNVRYVWDFFMTIALGLISVMLPYKMAWGAYMSLEEDEHISRSEDFFDLMFMVDVVLNFRTTYTDTNGKKVWDSFRVARHYMRSWFLLDFLSSVPLDRLRAGIPNLQLFRVLKIGKVGKVLKVVRMTRLMRSFRIFEQLDDYAPAWQTVTRIGLLTVTSLLLTHWMACIMVSASSGGFLDEYSYVSTGKWDLYLSSFYWAMTTMTTVGYGDILPTNAAERACAIIGMIVGGGFYGYVIGSITSIVSTADANARAYHERMGLVQAWLQYHKQLPHSLRLRISRHFREFLTEQTALDDSTIFHDLTPELREELYVWVVSDEVRFSILFENLPVHALARLVPILRKGIFEVKDNVVKFSDPGVAMFMVLQGDLIQTFYSREELFGTTYSCKSVESARQLNSKSLTSGDSFGEEIILGMEERYWYTVTTTSHVVVNIIAADAFDACFRTTPELIAQMKANYLNAPASFRPMPMETMAHAGSSEKLGHAAATGSGIGNLHSVTADHLMDTLSGVSKQLQVNYPDSGRGGDTAA